LLQSDLRSGK